jgi:hypothetical protein
LVSHVTIGKIKHFNAVEPYRLQDYIQRKEEQLNIQKEIIDQIVPSLIKIANITEEEEIVQRYLLVIEA